MAALHRVDHCRYRHGGRCRPVGANRVDREPIKVAVVPGWEPDVLPGYWQQTFPLGPDPDGEGDLFATLVRRGEPDPSATHAVLLVHGFTDYFFHTELADHFAARGFRVLRP